MMQQITSVCRTFLWTGQCATSRKALVAWERLCMPKSAGGLNIIEFQTWNKAAMSKLFWVITAKKDTLWVQWIHNFYIKRRDISEMETPKQACWLVRKIFDARKWYRNNDLYTELQQFTHADKFIIKKAFMHLIPQYPKVMWKSLNMGPCLVLKYQFILWLALRKGFTTVDRLAKWGIQVSRNCVLCMSDTEETHSHLFFECEYSRQLWSSFLRWTRECSQVRSWEEEVERLTTKRCNNKAHAEVLRWLLAATVYHIWSERNARRFQE
uniref:Reverse transcriptase zinc-binding domain-containing protein n=1 Tax=Nicotiana tabacum TaxID=4097 RepID=A0A1S4DC82_TOBAC|nr:PREDICTED: uncharacterized protein LOC107828276 [Nicotiana tabacum]